MPFDPNTQQQLQSIVNQDPQAFQVMVQNALNQQRNQWTLPQTNPAITAPNFSSTQTQNWNRPIMTNNYGVTPGLHGRMINNIQEIRPNEVSQDGVPSYFPTSDYSEIYAKAWNANGGIDTIKYVREQPTQPKDHDQSEFDQLMDRLDKIEQTLGQIIQRKQSSQNTKNRNNSGVDSSMNGEG